MVETANQTEKGGLPISLLVFVWMCGVKTSKLPRN